MDLSGFHPTRRRLIRALLLGACMSPAMAAIIKAGSAAAKEPVTQGFQKVVGDVRLNGAQARVGQVVRPGDICTTGPDSECIIIIGEQVFLLRAASEIAFDLDHFEDGRDASFGGRLRIAAGAVMAVFGDLRAETTVITPLATAGIRGTGLYAEIWPEKNYVCLCYGQAVLHSKLDPAFEEALDTFHHESPRNFYAKPEDHGGLFVEPEKMINHEDEELIMLEALVGRIPLFGPEPIKMPDQ